MTPLVGDWWGHSTVRIYSNVNRHGSLFNTSESVPLAAAESCLVVGIANGDTPTMRCDAETVKVRLAEIDAPGEALAVGLAQPPSCNGLVPHRGGARRPCTGGGRDGLSLPPLPHGCSDRVAEAAARAAHLGLWADPALVPPWEVAPLVAGLCSSAGCACTDGSTSSAWGVRRRRPGAGWRRVNQPLPLLGDRGTRDRAPCGSVPLDEPPEGLARVQQRLRHVLSVGK